ncbi:hypothetical protein [Sphingomonas endolithica]|uniref:hypothetical protein n=1 Tax=Sphingomonas endolithica TaxID=2972485 RepID=UPI0021B02E70|nr:hypothetical protein [Sphingomonas sp. ZFBP2030]
MSHDRLWPAVLGAWAVAAIVLLAASFQALHLLWFPDPDDAMRLVEVRDWLAGQSWWDVGQHRLNGGDFAMHWSRLVDLPLAAVIVPLDPLVGTALATRVALAVVPLLTLLCVMALAAEMTRRLLDAERARWAVLLAPLSVPLVYQLRPLRIDHHGWQIVLAMAATMLLLGPPSLRRGALSGLALGLLLTISLEGLPITVAIVGTAALAWAIDPTRRAYLVASSCSLLATIVVLQAATRGPAMFDTVCDAVSPSWLAVLCAAALGLSAASFLRPAALSVRLALLGAVGLGCGTIAVLLAPQCLAGPFSTLDELVYRLWYENVSEGLPVWRQVPSWAIMSIGMPIVGLVGSLLALRAATGPTRGRWAMLLGVAGVAFVLSVFVMRASGTANALALPGTAWVLHALLSRARAIPALLPRILATAGALLVASPGLVGGAMLAGMPRSAAPRPGPGDLARPSCGHSSDVSALATLPQSTVFAPIDITPQLLAVTRHRAIGAGYHRNDAALHRVLATFIGNANDAHHEILRSRAEYVVGCPGLFETELYKNDAPNGFWARLERGERFDWLTPVTLDGSPLLVWRVGDPSRKPLSRMPARP